MLHINVIDPDHVYI